MTAITLMIDGVPFGNANQIEVTYDREEVDSWGSGPLRSMTANIEYNIIDFQPANGEAMKKRYGIRDEDGVIDWCKNKDAAEAIFGYLDKNSQKKYELISQVQPDVAVVKTTED